MHRVGLALEAPQETALLLHHYSECVALVLATPRLVELAPTIWAWTPPPSSGAELHDRSSICTGLAHVGTMKHRSEIRDRGCKSLACRAIALQDRLCHLQACFQELDLLHGLGRIPPCSEGRLGPGIGVEREGLDATSWIVQEAPKGINPYLLRHHLDGALPEERLNHPVELGRLEGILCVFVLCPPLVCTLLAQASVLSEIFLQTLEYSMTLKQTIKVQAVHTQSELGLRTAL
mmetsp:Transcript_19007/g.53164  ORF Transcript_19007/g.53164 Transcript_19007/m.53164 type:complete len:234 (-) Transcript_19007:624-1325(-)